jgi:hypothetical protein
LIGTNSVSPVRKERRAGKTGQQQAPISGGGGNADTGAALLDGDDIQGLPLIIDGDQLLVQRQAEPRVTRRTSSG